MAQPKKPVDPILMAYRKIPREVLLDLTERIITSKTKDLSRLSYEAGARDLAIEIVTLSKVPVTELADETI